jgi:hypothetical protein
MTDLLEDMAAINAAYGRIKANLTGRTVRIVSDYNGQPYGRSRPSQRGRVAKIVSVVVDAGEAQPQVLLDDWGCYMDLDEVELL